MIPINDKSDPRIAHYLGLRQARSVAFSKASSDYFVVEGNLIVKRLIESDYEVESLLVQSGKEHSHAAQVEQSTPVYSMSAELLKSVVGFDFHRGVLACARRRPMKTVRDFLQSDRTRLALGLLSISDPENLGGMLRTAAALGIDQILLGQNTIDPFSRRVIRVSMATALKHQFYLLDSPVEELLQIQSGGLEIIASSLELDATALNEFDRNEHAAVLLIGNEANGLDENIQQIARNRVRIPMKQGVDSLNAASAAAILMYQLTK